jgi:hypothetical protein
MDGHEVTMGNTISNAEVQKAANELARMRSSLRGWLKYRTLNDQVMAGTARTRVPLAYAQRAVAQARDMATEQDLADKLHALLNVVMQGRDLPNADLRANPQGAVQLAQIAIAGDTQVMAPVATGGLFSAGASHPWLWPVLIVGGLLLTITTAIKTAADVAKDREEKACITAGACTDYGFWLKAGGIAALAYLAWTQMGGREAVHSLTKGRR